MKTHVLVTCGGDGSEHAISLISADFITACLRKNPDFAVTRAVLHERRLTAPEGEGEITAAGTWRCGGLETPIDCCVPVFHGVPGETGDFQSYLTLFGIPYLGCDSEASRYCFNKVTAKLYFTALGLPHTPYAALAGPTPDDRAAAEDFFRRWGDVYVKAASQGSSVGCYHVRTPDDLWDRVLQAFTFSDEVLVEKAIAHRELEVAAYEIDGRLVTTDPGEIIIPADRFYTYDEKYSRDSATVTTVTPDGLDDDLRARIRALARRAFLGMKLRDLARIDLFWSPQDGLLLNEINTFPGMTPISMFPQLLRHRGHDMTEFLTQAVLRAVARAR